MTGRILWVGDGGAHTGFAQATHAVTDRLVDRGFDVHILAANHRGDYWPSKAKMYPANLIGMTAATGDPAGFGRITEMLGRVVPDVVVFMHDPHLVMSMLLDNRFDPERVLWNGVKFGETLYKPPIIAYLPIDGYDSPKSWDILSTRATRVSFSQFGVDTAMPEATYAPLGIDHSVYKPMNRTQAKRVMGYDPDRFLVLRVDKNSSRKDYPATWAALRPLLRKYPDIDVHFHCLPRVTDGYDLRSYLFNDGDIRDRVNFSPNLGGFTGWSDEELAVLYSAADLYVSNSWAEGFGLGLLAALACGTPVVATDCSSIPEVVGPGGVLVPPSRRIASPMGQEQCLSDIAGFTEAIEQLYLHRKRRLELGKRGFEHSQQFTWDRTTDIIERVILDAIARNEADLKEKAPAVA